LHEDEKLHRKFKWSVMINVGSQPCLVGSVCLCSPNRVLANTSVRRPTVTREYTHGCVRAVLYPGVLLVLASAFDICLVVQRCPMSIPMIQRKRKNARRRVKWKVHLCIRVYAQTSGGA
jgi:hypothetical protein